MPYFNVIKLDATDSTNEALKRRHQSGEVSSGDLIWAEKQLLGKGQRAASWTSEPHKNLTFSIYHALSKGSKFDLMHANAQIALEVHSALESFSIPKLKIKWPNDILSGNKKSGGVLVETIFRGPVCVAMIIGVGINVNQTEFPSLPRASSMAVSAKTEFSRAELFKTLQQRLFHAFNTKKTKHELLSKYNALLFKKDIPASFRVQDTVFTGCIRKVNPQGMLVVENEDNQSLEFAIKEVELLY